MHGEYKMPGGKLIVADCELCGGRLSRVSISGDFFLEPDAALDAINAALEGQRAGTTAAALAAAIRLRLNADTRLFGISPEAVATAVQRAVGAAT